MHLTRQVKCQCKLKHWSYVLRGQGRASEGKIILIIKTSNASISAVKEIYILNVIYK